MTARSLPEWIGKTPDTTIPDRVKLRVFERAHGRCQKCTRKLRPRHWDTDHIQALINGGENRESNLQVLCDDPCHPKKTKEDVREKSRSYERRLSNAGVKKRTKFKGWRRMNGEIVFAPRQS